jgi:monoterpene epsilon-lactone hydrolase
MPCAMTLSYPVSAAVHQLFHPLTPADRHAMAALRQAYATAHPYAAGDGEDSRQVFDRYLLQTPAYPGVTYEAATVGGIPGWWYRVAGSPQDCAVLYLHGGAYLVGSAAGYRHLGSQLAGRLGVDFFAADYRLAPEHPFPAAVDDALAAYQGLAALGKQRVALCGDSAGGGLALVTLATIRAAASELGLPLPQAAAVLSPWADLTTASPSLQTRAAFDPLLTPQAVAQYAANYLHGHHAQDPLASPLYGDLRNLPPLQLHVGTDELLLDDARRYAAQAQAAAGRIDLHVWEGMPHVFATQVGTLGAADLALKCIAEFLRLHLHSVAEPATHTQGATETGYLRGLMAQEINY